MAWAFFAWLFTPRLKCGLDWCQYEQTEPVMALWGVQPCSASLPSLRLSLLPSVLHDNKLTHTDLKPENILFVNSDYELSYNLEKVTHCLDLGLLLDSWCP